MRYFVGWDVGAWNCNKHSGSQDAIAILKEENGSLTLCGTTDPKVYRGPLRAEIAEIESLGALIDSTCGVKITVDDDITLAIDTPLGLPEAVQWHVTLEKLPTTVPKKASANPYLYRYAERKLADLCFPPLSAVKDMIGSQSTKGIHLLRKLSLERQQTVGVWKKGRVTAIECYPATCKRSVKKGYICHGSPSVQRLFVGILGADSLPKEDQEDAVYCALIAYLFASKTGELVSPGADVPASEGWIWYPKDSVGRVSRKKKEP